MLNYEKEQVVIKTIKNKNMIPKINRSKLFSGAVVIHDEEYTWLFDGIHNVFTLFKNGEEIHPFSLDAIKKIKL